MSKKSLIPDHLKYRSWFSKKAGSFSNTAQRTVQLWTEKGAIVPEVHETSGPGDRRSYSTLNCIEIGIAKALSEDRVPFKQISVVIEWLKFGEKLLRLLEYDNGYLGLQIAPDQISEDMTFQVLAFDDYERLNQRRKNLWAEFTTPKSCDKTLIININRIARRVIAAME